mmetsp:Transcript_3226/g.7677  ORF Transcript_3226/g.7677 Transcript_3226/m.7677 type:complete len:95 (+) Transcript_3226:1479-1763(+)
MQGADVFHAIDRNRWPMCVHREKIRTSRVERWNESNPTFTQRMRRNNLQQRLLLSKSSYFAFFDISNNSQFWPRHKTRNSGKKRLKNLPVQPNN